VLAPAPVVVVVIAVLLSTTEVLVLPAATSFTTTPARVKASPEISTTVFGLVSTVSVETCPNNSALVPRMVMKQKRSAVNGVVAHPSGQQTLLAPLTENVVYPLVWHTPTLLLLEIDGEAAKAVAQPTSEKIVVAPLAVMVVGLGVMGVGHWRAWA
jgi:hypothetical protein